MEKEILEELKKKEIEIEILLKTIEILKGTNDRLVHVIKKATSIRDS